MELPRLFRSALKTTCPHQWAKNIFVFLPLLLAHVIAIHRLLPALLASCSFSLTASSAYIVNDLSSSKLTAVTPRSSCVPLRPAISLRSLTSQNARHNLSKELPWVVL